jgi:hypothetical protein
MSKDVPFNNFADTPERRKQFREDQRRNLPGTLLDVAQVDAGATQGRFAKDASQTSKLIGRGAVYPPASGSQYSPEARIADFEPPLNLDVNYVEPVGNFDEIERSISIANAQPEQIAEAIAEVEAGGALPTTEAVKAVLGRKIGVLRERAPATLAEMSDAQLEFVIAKASNEQRLHFEGGEVDRLQEIIDAGSQELRRRRCNGPDES